MAHNNGKITSPISLHGDVYPVLAIAPSGAYYDVAEVCKSGKINKWSFKKPIRFAQFPELTDAQIMSVNCGLTAKELTLLKPNCNGLNGVTGRDDTKDTILNEIAEWSYMQPNEYYRLTDFDGYNHAALPSDKEWGDYSFTENDLLEVLENNAYFVPPSTENDVNFTIPNSFKILTNFSMRIGDGSGNWIGSGDENMLPLSYAAGGGFINGQSWRIAYAVEIGSEWFLFIGRKPLDASLDSTTTKNYCPPDMSSNTLAVQRMSDSSTKTFTAIPCLVRNARIAFTYINQSTARSYVQVSSDTIIYAMPSGAQSIRIQITSQAERPQVGNISVMAVSDTYNTAYTWVLGYVMIQENPDGTPVNALVVARNAEINNESTAYINMQYYTKANGDTPIKIPTTGGSTNTQPYTIPAGSKFTFRGVTYNGYVIESAAGLWFGEKDVTIFNVQ